MQKFLVSLFLLFPAHSIASTVIVLKGGDTPFQRHVFSGYSSVATEKISAFRYDVVKEQTLLDQIKRMAPDLIFTIGQVPIRKLTETLPSTPLLVSQPMGDLPKSANLFILDQEQPIRNAITLLQGLFPTKKTIGTIYNPKLSQNAFNLLVSEAAKLGFRVASLKVDNSADAKTFINSLSGKIDFFFWLRDETTSDPTVLSSIYEFTEKNNLPLISSDPSQIGKGALLALAYDPFLLGEKAWDISKMIIKDKKLPSSMLSTDNFPVVVSISLKATGQFGLGSDSLYSFLQRTLKTSSKIELLP